MNESVLGYSQKELDKIPNYILYIKMLEQVDGTLGDIKDEISIDFMNIFTLLRLSTDRLDNSDGVSKLGKAKAML